MLDNVAGFQVDKAKFMWELFPDEVADLTAEFQRAVGDRMGPNGGKSWNVASVGKGEQRGTFKYIFDVWGEAAQFIDYLDYGRWMPHASRIDLKVGMDVTSEGLDDLYNYLSEKIGKHRKLVRQHSPIRQKRESRDSGGDSLSLGSHKSDFRTQWTARGNESGYMEYQVQGDMLSASVGTARWVLANPSKAETVPGWQGFAHNVLVHAQMELQDVTGMYQFEIADIVAGKKSAHETVELQLAQIERHIDRLPQDAMHGLYYALQIKLFGEPKDTRGNTDNDDEDIIPVGAEE